MHLPASTCKVIVKICFFLSSNVFNMKRSVQCVTLPFSCNILCIIMLNVQQCTFAYNLHFSKYGDNFFPRGMFKVETVFWDIFMYWHPKQRNETAWLSKYSGLLAVWELTICWLGNTNQSFLSLIVFNMLYIFSR